MGFNIPNYTDAVGYGSGDMAEPDSIDFQALGNAACAVVYDPNYASNGVVNFVSSTSVSVGSYHVVINGTHYTVLPTNPATSLAVAAGDASPRFDLVVYSSTSGLKITKGTPSAVNPVYPALASNEVLLAALYVPSGGLSSTGIIDKRVFISSNTTRYEASAPGGASVGAVGDFWINTTANATGQSELYYKTGNQWENVALYVPMSSSNTASNLVLRDGSGGFSAGSLIVGSTSTTVGAITLNSSTSNISGVVNLTASTINATTVTAALSGNASTATRWATARTIGLTGNASGSVSIDGTADATINVTNNYATNAAYATTSGTASTAAGLNNAGATISWNGSWWNVNQECDFNAVVYMYSVGPSSADSVLVLTGTGEVKKRTLSPWSLRGLKEDINTIDNALQKVKSLTPRSFRFKESSLIPNDSFDHFDRFEQLQYGFVVEELLDSAVPNVVLYQETADGTISPQSWKPYAVLSLAIGAIQELAARVEALEAKK